MTLGILEVLQIIILIFISGFIIDAMIDKNNIVEKQ
jgi:hypothetical protein